MYDRMPCTRTNCNLYLVQCRRYDLRWPVIADRFEFKPNRTIEELKNRFYLVTTRIIAERMRDKDPMVCLV